LNWFAPTNLNVPIAKYKVTLRNLASGSQRTFMVSGTPTWWNEIWFSHAGAPTGNTTYRYTVQTGIYDANGALVFSGPSNVVDVSPRIPISPPCLSASNSGRGVYLNWTSPIKGTASEYIVTRTRVGPGDGSASDGTVRFVVNGSRVTYYDQAVLPTYKDPYMYSIQAKDASGNLSASSPVVYAY
jgi:hypothetical protein